MTGTYIYTETLRYKVSLEKKIRTPGVSCASQEFKLLSHKIGVISRVLDILREGEYEAPIGVLYDEKAKYDDLLDSLDPLADPDGEVSLYFSTASRVLEDLIADFEDPGWEYDYPCEPYRYEATDYDVR